MVELEGIGDYWGLIAIAAGAGAFGGVISELLPGATAGKWWASLVIGAGAAVAIMVVLPPTEDTVRTVKGQPVTTTEYDLIKLVATAIIAGSAGPRVFSAMQARTLAAAAQERMEATVATSHAAVKELREHIPAVVQEQVASHAAPIVAQAANTSPDEAGPQAQQLVEMVASQSAESVSDALSQQISATQSIIAAAASGEAPPS